MDSRIFSTTYFVNILSKSSNFLLRSNFYQNPGNFFWGKVGSLYPQMDPCSTWRMNNYYLLARSQYSILLGHYTSIIYNGFGNKTTTKHRSPFPMPSMLIDLTLKARQHTKPKLLSKSSALQPLIVFTKTHIWTTLSSTWPEKIFWAIK